MTYSDFITTEDVKAKGYDLTNNTGLLVQGDFDTLEEAAADFLKTCFDTIYDLIEGKRGAEWAEDFFEDMAEEINQTAMPKAYKLQKALKKAILIQTIYLLENGDSSDTSEKSEASPYSTKALRLLYSNGII